MTPWTGEAESVMDELALSLRMKRLTQWLNENCQPTVSGAGNSTGRPSAVAI
jgi:hypothetical protein